MGWVIISKKRLNELEAKEVRLNCLHTEIWWLSELPFFTPMASWIFGTMNIADARKKLNEKIAPIN